MGSPSEIIIQIDYLRTQLETLLLEDDLSSHQIESLREIQTTVNAAAKTARQALQESRRTIPSGPADARPPDIA